MSELKQDIKNLAVIMHSASTLGHETWGLLDKGRQHAYERMALAVAGNLPLQRVWELSAQLEQATKERDELKKAVTSMRDQLSKAHYLSPVEISFLVASCAATLAKLNK